MLCMCRPHNVSRTWAGDPVVVVNLGAQELPAGTLRDLAPVVRGNHGCHSQILWDQPVAFTPRVEG